MGRHELTRTGSSEPGLGSSPAAHSQSAAHASIGCARFHTTPATTPLGAARRTLRLLARRWASTTVRTINQVDVELDELTAQVVPKSSANTPSIGSDICRGALARGDNPDRLERERSFAAVVAPHQSDAVHRVDNNDIDEPWRRPPSERGVVHDRRESPALAPTYLRTTDMQRPDSPKAAPRKKSSAASSDMSHVKHTEALMTSTEPNSNHHRSPLDIHRSIGSVGAIDQLRR